jgi:bidirectional [NiFe] hydrogenase diaphorase subunit
MAEISLTIDGRSIKAQSGQNILEVALKNKISIPNLCYNENLEPYGECRLCTVEISVKQRKRLVAACCYPVEEGLTVITQTPRLKQIRKVLIELLLAQSPSGAHTALAKEYGITESRFPAQKGEYNCTLCGICVRYCEELRHENAVTFEGRGIDRHVVLVPGAVEKCRMCRKCFDYCDAGGIAYLVDKSCE